MAVSLSPKPKPGDATAWPHREPQQVRKASDAKVRQELARLNAKNGGGRK